MAKHNVKRVDVKHVGEETIERDIAQNQVLLANALNRQVYLEQRGAPEWILQRYREDRDDLVEVIARLKRKLNRIRTERNEANE